MKILLLVCFSVISAFAQPSLYHALSFDGVDQHVDIPHIDEFTSDEFTFEAWFRVEDFTRTQMIMSKEGVMKLFINTEGKVGFQFKHSGRWTMDFSIFPLHSNLSVVPGQWHHIAVTLRLNEQSRLKMAVYLDDINPYRAILHGRSYRDHASTPLRIGESFRGQIGEVRYWSTARSNSQIIDHRDTALDGSEVGLLGAWILDKQID